MKIKADNGKTYRRIHDGFIMGCSIVLGIDHSTGTPRQDKEEYYEQVPLYNAEWHNYDYIYRIVIPKDWIEKLHLIRMHFEKSELPVYEEDALYLYCNTILPEHQGIVDGLQGIIVIEEKRYIKNHNSKEIHDRTKATPACNIDKIKTAVYLTTDEAIEKLNDGTGDGCGHCMNEFNTTTQEGL